MSPFRLSSISLITIVFFFEYFFEALDDLYTFLLRLLVQRIVVYRSRVSVVSKQYLECTEWLYVTSIATQSKYSERMWSTKQHKAAQSGYAERMSERVSE
nr:MAG: hypothetical protein AmFV_00229 [Apis mellifera filamentous virus]